MGKHIAKSSSLAGEKTKKARTPLVAGDPPETDLSEFCDQNQINQYQIIVGQLIWLTGLG